MTTHHFSRVLWSRCLGLLALGGLLLAACGAPDSPSGTSSGGGATGGNATAGAAANTSGGGATNATAGAAANAAGGESDCEKVNSDLKIGMDMSLTSGTADLGEGARKGYKLAIKEYNAKGGYKGKPVQCILLDDATKPEQGLANTTRMIDQDKVFGLIAYANSGVAVPGAKQAQTAGVPLIVPVATATNITAQFPDPGSFVFHMSMADVNQVAVMMQLLDKQGLKKPALLHDTSGYGKLGADDLTKALKAKNLPPVEDQSFDAADTDMTAQLTKAKNAGADVIMTYALAPALANLLKSADRLNWYPPIVGSWTLAQPDMVKFATPDVVKKFKIYTVQSFTVDRDANAKAFHDKIMKEYGSDPVPITAAQGYDATNAMLMALDKAGPDRKALRDAIEGLDGLKAVTTAPSKPYTPANHEAINVKDMFLAQLQESNGQITVVKAQ